jgi:methionine salvage enolase-phosphatase E1
MSNFDISGPILSIKSVLEMLFDYAFESLETLLKSTDSEEN